MAIKYRMKRPEAIDAFADAGISTAVELQAAAAVSRAAAQAVFRGDAVSRTTAIRVVSSVNKMGGDASVSTIFEEVTP